MGLYTWVTKYCCEEEIQFQSKACHEMEYGEHDLRSVPVEVAKDIDGNTEECRKCGSVFKIQVSPRDISNVAMEIVTIIDTRNYGKGT